MRSNALLTSAFLSDILEFDLSLLPPHTKVVANLPYHLTAPILTLLAPRHDLFSTLTLMVQDEVARRITAVPKTKEYGSLTVFLNFYASAHYAFKVSHHCFYPQPKVDSAIITLTLKKPAPVDAESFFHCVRTAFQHRRKMIKTTLGAHLGPILEHFGINPQARPEELNLEQWLKVFSRLDKN